MDYRKRDLARFQELEEKRNKILAVLEPLQKELKELVADGRESPDVRAKIVEVRGPLFDIDQERKYLANALKTLA